MNPTHPVTYWKESAADAMDTSDTLFTAKKYQHSLFFLHLSLEKILKALYINTKKASPPPIHDLVRLSEQCDLVLTEDQKLQLAEISTFNVATRYDDYKLQFHKKATPSYTGNWRTIGTRLYSYIVSLLS
ncbi:MAG: HEPN protein [uncultured bacterium]|uniref:HEPN domain-containing protein n=1 Tax=Candidatus Gottesmanbacteria bacterium RIFCSPLOWO2_01_FULL_43_11b TaxID=1798392 RepID=A0A1F6AHV1_9BACT|nr:MAG: HEPN protein [uncultured bacterium]OGG23847.1 MAG: hypothetical protein A3A79_01425 [Candidatus Gottesmanbacteria bacterium RIFCSPLOWO2_01_FULL_43_11b]